jgi:hypothetical protein
MIPRRLHWGGRAYFPTVVKVGDKTCYIDGDEDTMDPTFIDDGNGGLGVKEFESIIFSY